MSDVTHVSESCHTNEWVMVMYKNTLSLHVYIRVISHIRMSHATNTNESWRTRAWVMVAHETTFGAHIYESCRTYECEIAQKPRSRGHMYTTKSGLHAEESCCACEWVMAHECTRRDRCWTTIVSSVYTIYRSLLSLHLAIHMAIYRFLCLYIQAERIYLYIQTKRPIHSHIKQDTWKYIGLFVCIYRHIRMAISRSLLYTLYIYTYGYI